ncbi:MAG: hypothetical protein DHS20C18_21030 [Saprospiraceae bacterium]|nr:MAG: hypothetical protein DHS20C18_21030 [Saprospiraceae bacterium]
MKRLGWIICCVLGVCQLTAQVGVTGELTKTDIMIGDQVEFRLNIEKTSNAQIEKIDLSPLDSIEGIEVLNVRPMDTISRSPLLLTQQRITLTSFDSGYYYLPKISVTYIQSGIQSTVTTNEIPLTVNTLPVSTDTVRLEPIKDIIEEPVKFQDALPYLAGLAGLIAIIGLIWYYIKKRKQKPEEETPEVRLPAHEVALQKLHDLQKAELWQKGEIKAFQSELTFILREYLEHRFNMRALESTTDEIVADLKHSEIDADWHPKIETILETADLVKFAKAEPPIEIHARAIEETEVFVETTKKIELPPEEEAKPEEEDNV